MERVERGDAWEQAGRVAKLELERIRLQERRTRRYPVIRLTQAEVDRMIGRLQMHIDRRPR